MIISEAFFLSDHLRQPISEVPVISLESVRSNGVSANDAYKPDAFLSKLFKIINNDKIRT